MRTSDWGSGRVQRPWGGRVILAGGQSQSGHTAELHWYPEKALAFALQYNAAPRVPNLSVLIPRAVLGVPEK